MDGLTLLKTIAGIGGGLGVAIPVLHRYVVRPIRKGVVGLMETHARVKAMDAQLQPNSGDSLVDKVGALGSDLSAMKRTQERNGERIETIDERTADTNETLKRQVGRTDQIFDLLERPLFEGDAAGRMTRVNEAFARMIGVSVVSLLGLGWVSLLALAERGEVMRELTAAARFRRMYRVPVTFDTGAKRIKAILVAQPTLDAGEVLAYQGALEVVNVTETTAS